MSGSDPSEQLAVSLDLIGALTSLVLNPHLLFSAFCVYTVGEDMSSRTSSVVMYPRSDAAFRMPDTDAASKSRDIWPIIASVWWHMYLHTPLFLFILQLFSPTDAREPAWNGHVIPGARTPSKFTPFYVPPGSRAIYSTDPLVSYSGSWRTSHSANDINDSAQTTSEKGASATLLFSGTGIELYGSKGKRFGQADVKLDGKLIRTLDGYSNRDLAQQLMFFSYGLSPSEHSIKIINKGSKSGSLLEVDAFVINSPISTPNKPAVHSEQMPPEFRPSVLATNSNLNSEWTLLQKGSTGVAAMQLAIISQSHAVIIDKVEHNPLTINGHPAWGALYNLNTHSLKPLDVRSNSFCSGGAFLSNGTLINVGGNPVVADKTAAADFGDVDGLQAIRLFHPCDSEIVSTCEIYENHNRIRMASPRWYNTVTRISDGSAMIIGGSKKGGWMNNETTNNPTIEYYPPKGIHGSKGLPITLPFLKDTLNSNLFPIAFSLPGGKVFLAANNDATIYDWQANLERRLPQIPNGVRVTYPMTGTGLFLPLSSENNYTPEILLCGGSTVDDTKPGYEINSQDPASAQCARMILTDEGISAGWQTEQMPQARTMPDAVLLPTGKILIVNGAGSGISGYANVIGQVGQSNADNPVFTPVLYDPSAPSGSRFSSSGMPTSQIPRLYHSVATLTPKGDIMIAGSNPNLDRSEVKYGTEYRVEWLSPPYMSMERPVINAIPSMIGFGQKVKMNVNLPNSASDADVKVACMDLGYVTHAVHANSRLVYLVFQRDADILTVTGPPDGGVYPPGPAFIYLVVDGVPSVGRKVIIGDGKDPDVDKEALDNVLRVDQYEKIRKSGDGGDDE